MKTGIVVKNTKKSTIVLSENAQFEKLRSKPDLAIGQQIYYFKEDEYSTRNSTIIKMGSLVAALLIVILFVSLLKANTPFNSSVYAIVTVDINPSVEISLDSNNSVIGIKNLNQDAKQVISKDMIGKLLNEVLKTIVDNAHAKGFLLEDGDILISSVVMNNASKVENSTVATIVETPTENTTTENATKVMMHVEQEDALEALLNDIMLEMTDHYNFMYVKGTEDALKAANSQGLSLGKFEILQFMDDDITQADIKTMKVAEIVERKEIKALSKSEEKELKFINKGDRSEDVTSEEGEKVIPDKNATELEDQELNDTTSKDKEQKESKDKDKNSESTDNESNNSNSNNNSNKNDNDKDKDDIEESDEASDIDSDDASTIDSNEGNNSKNTPPDHNSSDREKSDDRSKSKGK